MPDALLRNCTGRPGCPNLTTGGPCADCAHLREQQRGSAASRGYDWHWTNVFKPWWIRKLLAFDIAPRCGARWPGAPVTGDSTCGGRLVLIRKRDHILDHTPPLRDDERTNRTAVEDPMRVQLLCQSCANAKTRREQGRSV